MLKQRIFIFLVLCLGVLMITACSGASSGPQGDPELGKAKFDASCVSCHGPDAKGLPDLGKDLTVSEFVAGMTQEEMVAFLKVGRSVSDPLNTTNVDMPPKGGNPALNDEDLLNIAAYLDSINK